MSVRLSDLANERRMQSLYERGTSLALIGPPGVGKSDTVRWLPTMLSKLYDEAFGYMEVLAPSIDAPDVRGYMIPTKDEDGRPISQYTYPAILPTPKYLAEHPRGILFVDEFSQSDHLVQKGMSPLLLEGRIGDFPLPKGWWVITASNRMSDRAGVVKPLMHNINRQCIIEIRPDLDAWVAWAQKNNIHPMGIAFAKSRPGTVFTDEVPAEPKPFCTPRSFVSAMRLMQGMAGDSMDLPNDTVTQEMVQGDIGQGAAAEFFGFIKVADQLPTIEEILANPAKAKVPRGERLDAAYAAQQLCIHHASEKNVDAIWEYSTRLPKELQVSTAKALMEKHNQLLLSSKAMSKWVRENRSLIMNTTES